MAPAVDHVCALTVFVEEQQRKIDALIALGEQQRVHESLATAPIAQEAIDLILDLYRVEYEARDAGTVGTNSHFELRKQKSARDRLKARLDTNLDRRPPKSPIGVAIRYGLSSGQSSAGFSTMSASL